MKEQREDRYNEEMLDRVFLFGLSGLKKHLKTTGSAVGFIAFCTFAIVTALLITSDLGNTGVGVVLSVLIGGVVGGGIACLAIPVKKRDHAVRAKFSAVEAKHGREEKKGSAA
ncbi:MAG TPA: hypothetical protein PK629_09950 [Oscillospiraceae bacterium]|nr:hypothetical protein [Oscillospiraceae bacterium]HPF54911.1 hypothetical protein [Clostridiales bacterium]HPK34970.1 hypothetical protein [Oscillospiraceae bacterium]HPR75528.1 hypothetical protein [Oscillospiraceae bacterium]